jgi:type II secretory pathway component PulJ
MLELMVAMAILGILILLMGQIFHQSSVAWDSGLRKAKGNMSARAALGFMSREMSGAVAYRDDIPTPKLDVDMRSGGPSQVIFRKLTRKDGSPNRAVERIRYYLAGDALMRDMQELVPSSGGAEAYGRWDDEIHTHIVATNIASLQFLTPNDESFTDYKLPPWLCIRIGVTREDDVSGVGTVSYGPDGLPGTDDDISSY